MAEHNFQIKSDSPAAGDMMFWTIVGHETLSRPSFYELRVLSKVDKMAATDVLGHAFDVVIEFEDADGGKHERHCQGHAVRFVRAGAVGRYFEYRISLRSLFWLLGKRVNSRILQDKSALEVLDAVYEDSPIKRFKKTKTDKVIGKHPKRTYVVQYQESDYHYLSRLLEDEGIYYWFDAHEEPGTMHLADISDVAHEKLPAADTLSYSRRMGSDVRFNEITRWLDARRLNSGKFASRDSDFKAITQKLAGDKADPDTHELADLEVFEFPGGYFKKDSTDERAKVRMEELASRRNLHWALTPWPDVAVGRTFTFKGDPLGERDADYLIAGCSFVVTHPGYEGTDAKDGNVQRLGGELLEMLADHSMGDDWLGVARDVAESTPDLRLPRPGVCTFLLTTLPVEHLYRPPRTTPRVTMPGPQSAIVVGPKGEEIYADDQGRVKVHFHWDRYDGSDEKSTCWVRVSQPWAGKGWGGYFIPRIGQEVIVDFLNGDPDRPIIVGRVYNDEQTIPFSSHTQSGFRTRSTPKGNASNCNEFRFEDKKGSEQVFLHAEKGRTGRSRGPALRSGRSGLEHRAPPARSRSASRSARRRPAAPRPPTARGSRPRSRQGAALPPPRPTVRSAGAGPGRAAPRAGRRGGRLGRPPRGLRAAWGRRSAAPGRPAPPGAACRRRGRRVHATGRPGSAADCRRRARCWAPTAARGPAGRPCPRASAL